MTSSASALVCELSGGFDSAAAALVLLRRGDSVRAVFVDYGQPYAEQERKAARYVASALKARYPETFIGLAERSAQLEQRLPDERTPAPYVPVRNLVLGALMMNYAQAHGCDVVAVGSKTKEHRPNDPYCFFDCTSAFYAELAALATLASETVSELRIVQPLIVDGVPLTKVQVVQMVKDSGMDIDALWNCYGAAEKPCGVCMHCEELHKVKEQLR